MTTADLNRMKAAAAHVAVAAVEDGMIVGLGTGSTAAFALTMLGRRVAEGLRIIGIPTSEETAHEASRLGIPLSTLGQHDHIDIAIDGADEVDVATLGLLKGRGGALLREKIIASACRQFVIIVDETKLVDRLGIHDPVVVEVVPFGWQATARRLRSLAISVARRMVPDEEPFVTDGGHYILDCVFAGIDDPDALQRRLDGVVGVVEHGLFLGLASRVIVGGSRGIRVLERRTEGQRE